MTKDLLIMFDLDGTLWDSAQAVAESWNEVFRKEAPVLPLLTADDIHGVMGLTMKEISETLQRRMKTEIRDAVFDECCRHEVEYLYSHPGQGIRTGGCQQLSAGICGSLSEQLRTGRSVP